MSAHNATGPTASRPRTAGRRSGPGLRALVGVVATSLFAMLPLSARADAVEGCAPLRTELERLWARLDAQERRLDAQESVLTTQERRLRAQDSLLDAQAEIIARQRSRAETGLVAESEDALAARSGTGPVQASSTPGPVGVAPEAEGAERRPDLALIADRGGVLTPVGVLTVEPEIEFLTASSLEFELDGTLVEEPIFIGDIQAGSSDREVVSSRLQARLGLRERLELSLEVPYVWRTDRFERQVQNDSDRSRFARRTRGGGLGDVALGLHYQLPRSRGDGSTWVGNLRIKSTTGSSPFEVDRGLDGVETELATGSGYWSVEPSVTWIRPTDPAVLYGTLGYTWNLPTDVDETTRLGPQSVRIGRVDPGDALGIGFGVGIALNETTSLSLGYSHRYVLGTQTEIDGIDFRSRPVHLGELQVGLSFLAGERPIRLTTSIGVTEGAPDVRMDLSTPVSWSLFE